MTRTLRLLLAAWLLMAVGGAQAQAQAQLPAPAPAPASPAPLEATVEVANREVAVFRAAFLGVEPVLRAQRTEIILREQLARAVKGEVTLKVEPQGHVLLIDGHLAFVLTAGDTDALRGQTLAQASEAARAALEVALAETREGRDTRRLLRALGFGLMATLAALAVAFLMQRLRRWATVRVAALLQARSAQVRVAGAELLHSERLVVFVGGVLRALSWLVVAVVAYQWLSYVLRLFPYTRPWGEELTDFLFGAAARMARGTLNALPDLFIAITIFFIARAVILLFQPFFARVASGSRSGGWLDADTAIPTRRIFSVAVWVFAVVMAYPYLPGAQSEAFKGMSVLIGLMITVGGSSLVNQAASGLVLMYSRALRVGEYVRIDDHEGTVTEMSAFTTRIRTGLGVELTLPNALVLGTVTRNYSRVALGSGFMVDTTVSVGYDTPWPKVEAMLLEAARRAPGISGHPPPRVFHTALADFNAAYRLVCQAEATEPRPRAEVLSRLHATIQDVFNEHGVALLSPQYITDPAQAPAPVGAPAPTR